MHTHVLVPDGALEHDGVVVDHEVPDDNDVGEILVRAGRKVIALLHRFFDEDEPRLTVAAGGDGVPMAPGAPWRRQG